MVYIQEHRCKVNFVEVEVDTLQQLAIVLNVKGIDMILLDNMTPEQLREAVVMRDAAGRGEIQLEASGGITLDNVIQIAQTGVDRISIGALTHTSRSLDIGFEAIGI